MLFDRRFGVEIEAYAQRGDTMAAVATALTAGGVTANWGGSHLSRAATDWVVKPDGSLNEGNGMEIASPPLSGEEGLEAIRKVCAVLETRGFTVKRSCGLHIHVSRPSAGGMRRLAIDYANHERMIDALLPPSRRGTSCRWAGTLTMVPQRRFAQSAGASEIASAIGHGKYSKVNFTASWVHGTVEFRHHSGTVDATKIINWAKFCLRMVDKADANPVSLVAGGAVYHQPRPSLSRTQRRYRNTQRGRAFVRLLTRPEGATRDEIFAETGWRRGSLSMSGMARDAGLELRSRRLINGSRRYYGSPAATATQAPARQAQVGVANFEDIQPQADFSAFASYLEMEPDEVRYWNARRGHDWHGNWNYNE